MSRFERLLLLVNLFKSGSSWTVPELASKCKVGYRTIYRDIYSLSRAGVPVYSDDGFYKLLPRAFLPTLNFTLDDYKLILNSLRGNSFHARGDRLKVRQVLAKIEATMPEHLRPEIIKIKKKQALKRK